MTQTPNPTTKFTICSAHTPLLSGESRYRKAEIFAEGGPSRSTPCTARGCRIIPGRDLFILDLCSSTYDTHTGPFAWSVNEVPS